MSNSLSLLSSSDLPEEPKQGGMLKKVAVSVLGGAIGLAAAGAAGRLVLNTYAAHQETPQQKAGDAAVAKGVALEVSLPTTQGSKTLEAHYTPVKLSPFRLSDPAVPLTVHLFTEDPASNATAFGFGKNGGKIAAQCSETSYGHECTGTISYTRLRDAVGAQGADQGHAR